MAPKPALGNTGKRLILATAAAIACQLVLTYVISHIPGIEHTSFRTPLGWLQPATYLTTALSMAVGGWLGGKRFIPVALVVSAFVWAGTLYVLARTASALTGESFTRNLISVVGFNKANIVCGLLAAALGALAGAWWQRRHAPARQLWHSER